MTDVTAPDGFGPEATWLWAETTAAYELAPHELMVLEQACRTRDDIDRLERALDVEDLLIEGSKQQLVANPLISELRQHRQSFRTLVKALALPDPADATDEGPRSSATSRSARKAAEARWHRRTRSNK